MNHKNKIKLISILGWVLCGLVGLAAAEPVPFTDISPEQALAMINAAEMSPQLTTVDVRRLEEFNQGFIKGALHIEVGVADFADKIAKLDKKGAYLVYCRGGMRSARAMGMMKEMGFERVYNLGGGIRKWQAANQPLEKPALAK